MNSNVFAAIITHGELACALANVAENLMTSEITLHCYSTKILSSEEIINQLEKLLSKSLKRFCYLLIWLAAVAGLLLIK